MRPEEAGHANLALIEARKAVAPRSGSMGRMRRAQLRRKHRDKAHKHEMIAARMSGRAHRNPRSDDE